MLCIFSVMTSYDSLQSTIASCRNGVPGRPARSSSRIRNPSVRTGPNTTKPTTRTTRSSTAPTTTPLPPPPRRPPRRRQLMPQERPFQCAVASSSTRVRTAAEVPRPRSAEALLDCSLAIREGAETAGKMPRRQGSRGADRC